MIPRTPLGRAAVVFYVVAALAVAGVTWLAYACVPHYRPEPTTTTEADR